MDQKDVKIIKMLQQDGRINFSDIAQRLKLSNATIHARIIKLQRKGIIKGFSTSINHKKINKPLSILLSIVVDHDKDTPEKTIKKILELTEVTNVYCITGDWDYHILLHTKDIDTMKELVTNKIKKCIPAIKRSSAQIILDSGEKPIEVEIESCS